MKITNRRAFYDYEVSDRFEAGVKLIGAEVKSVREGRVDLSGSFVKLIGGEAYLVHALIPSPVYARPEGYDERRSRKLLFHKRELISYKSKLQNTGMVLVPISLYFKNGFVKLEVGIGKGKRKHEKREAIKKKDLDRELQLELRNKS